MGKKYSRGILNKKLSMKGIFLILVYCFYFKATIAQTNKNLTLKAELDSILVLDQKYRISLMLAQTGKEDSLSRVYNVTKVELNAYLWSKQSGIDSQNIKRISDIIEQYGYPGKSLVGEPTNETAFYIIQHSKFIDKYLPIVEEAANKKELSFTLYAMMLDRSLMFQDKEQIYGTQATSFDTLDSKTGKWNRMMIIWPIKDPKEVNERRKTAGFEDSVEENAKVLDVHYKIYTVDQVKKMRGG